MVARLCLQWNEVFEFIIDIFGMVFTGLLQPDDPDERIYKGFYPDRYFGTKEGNNVPMKAPITNEATISPFMDASRS